MYPVVNQLTLEEFKKFTNFTEIMLAILNANCKKDILNVYIERNFKINVPNKDVWRAGGFASLRLTDEFYKSESAARIFRNVYGIKDCQVRLDPINISSIDRKDINATNNEQNFDFRPSGAPLDHINQPLRVECQKQKPIMIIKYPKKTMRTNVFGLPTTDSETNKCPKNELELSKLNNEQIDDKRSQNELQTPASTTSIPIENIARFMAKSDLRQHLRESLYDHFKEVEIQFEKYLAETDMHCWSLKDFLDDYHKSTTTESPLEFSHIQTEIIEETSLNISDDSHMTTETSLESV